VGISFDKSAVEVSEAKEDLDIVNRLGNGPIKNGGNTRGVHLDAFWGNNKAEEVGFLNMKLTLLELDIKFVFLETLKYPFDMFNVFFMGALGIHKNVIHVCDTELV